MNAVYKVGARLTRTSAYSQPQFRAQATTNRNTHAYFDYDGTIQPHEFQENHDAVFEENKRHIREFHQGGGHSEVVTGRTPLFMRTYAPDSFKGLEFDAFGSHGGAIKLVKDPAFPADQWFASPQQVNTAEKLNQFVRDEKGWSQPELTAFINDYLTTTLNLKATRPTDAIVPGTLYENYLGDSDLFLYIVDDKASIITGSVGNDRQKLLDIQPTVKTLANNVVEAYKKHHPAIAIDFIEEKPEFPLMEREYPFTSQGGVMHRGFEFSPRGMGKEGYVTYSVQHNPSIDYVITAGDGEHNDAQMLSLGFIRRGHQLIPVFPIVTRSQRLYELVKQNLQAVKAKFNRPPPEPIFAPNEGKGKTLGAALKEQLNAITLWKQA